MVTKENFIQQMQSDTGFDSGICEQVWQCIDSDKYDEFRDEFFKLYRTLTIDQLTANFQVFAPFYNIVHTDKVAGGMGRGEVACVLALKDSRTGGTVEHDVIVGDRLYEVKELEDDMFRPAKYGNAFNFMFTEHIQRFYRDIVSYSQFHSDIWAHVEPIADQSDRVASGYEWPVKTSLSAWYETFKLLHECIKPIQSDTIAIKTSEAATFIEVPMKILDILADYDKMANMLTMDPDVFQWKLQRHRYVANPEYFIDDLRDIRDGFFDKIDSLICFAKGKPAEPIICKKEDFCIFALSQGQYRFRLKDRKASHKYDFLQKQ